MAEELLDVLNEDGTPTGKRILKSEAHRVGAWHRAAHVWIVTPDLRVLLQRRAAVKENYPRLWDVSAAGHVAAGESAIEAAIREVREELGIALRETELEPIGRTREQCVLNEGRYIDNEIHEVFLVRRAVREIGELTLQPGEVDEVALVALDALVARVAERDETLVPHAEEYALLPGAIRQMSRSR
jgi:isopentenyl-diphosphate delta-isomerase